MIKEIKSIDDVLAHIEEIHKSMEFNEELFPIVTDLFLFLKDMIPILSEANISVKESTSHLPTATDNLNSVTQTTELATNEVLDKIEHMSSQLNALKSLIRENKESDKQLSIVEDVENKANEIIFAFQFQDITTQQLEHTNRILTAVYDKFLSLFESFEVMRSRSSIGAEVAMAIENEFKKELERHKEEMESFQKRTEDIIHQNHEFSQEDIDNFFK
ncbi:MAG: hypothetical protein D6677_03530 [Calditrichaeota bacterium]|nr:MAG: hypothetical protein D6677_03530 [Calditrichota bacterium]